MKYRYGILVVLAMVAVGGGVAMMGGCESSVSPYRDDGLEARWREQGNGVSTIRCRYKLVVNDAQEHDVALSWDVAGDRFYSQSRIVSIAGDKEPMVHVHVMGREVQWYALPVSTSDPLVWQVEVGRIKDSLAAFAYHSDAGMNRLIEMVTPYTLVERRRKYYDAYLEKGGTITICQDDSRPEKVVRTYCLEKEGRKEEEIVLEMDMTDGVRMLSVKQYCRSGEGRYLGYSAHYFDYQKYGEVWFPGRMMSSTQVAGGEVVESHRFEFEKVEINVPLGDETFVYQPPRNSRVYVRGHDGSAFVVGKSDLASMDIDDEVIVEALRQASM